MKDRKTALRKDLLARRSALPEDQVLAASRRAVGALLRAEAFLKAREVLLYMPVRNELDTRPLLPELWALGRRALLPRCRQDQRGELDIACVTCLEEIKPGMYEIPEPDPLVCPRLEEFRPDLTLVPGVGFDRRGYRLGFGGGYYDRLLARPEMEGSIRIGMAYSWQIVEELPVEPWDIKVHAVCTEEGILWLQH